MQTISKTLVSASLVLTGLAFAAPALAQTYTQPGYYSYPTYQQYPQYQQPSYSAYSSTQSNFQYGSCPALSYNLTLGSTDYSTGGQVSRLNSFLANRYNDQRVEGSYYSTLTASYVTRFQVEQGVYPATGGVGPLTRAALQRVCGGYNPTPTPQSSTTFRLDRNFTLSQGQAAHLSQGTLDITLNQIISPSYNYGYYYGGSQQATGVRITLGQACQSGTYCFYYPSQSFTLSEGDDVTFQGYTVELVSLTSTRATFRVTDDGRNDNNNDATIDVTAPKSGADVDQGDTLKITWKSVDEPSNSSVVLDLYTSGGSKVGTIAVLNDTDGSYSWHVPERRTFCTLQYPNGLCGEDLNGRYYVLASLVEGNGFNTGAATLDSDQSGTFTINR